jgi:hypothetical protein
MRTHVCEYTRIQRARAGTCQHQPSTLKHARARLLANTGACVCTSYAQDAYDADGNRRYRGHREQKGLPCIHSWRSSTCSCKWGSTTAVHHCLPTAMSTFVRMSTRVSQCVRAGTGLARASRLNNEQLLSTAPHRHTAVLQTTQNRSMVHQTQKLPRQQEHATHTKTKTRQRAGAVARVQSAARSASLVPRQPMLACRRGGEGHHLVLFFAEVCQEAVAAETPHARRVLTPEHAAAANLDVLAKVAIPARHVRRISACAGSLREPSSQGSAPFERTRARQRAPFPHTCGVMARSHPVPPHPPSASRWRLSQLSSPRPCSKS